MSRLVLTGVVLWSLAASGATLKIDHKAGRYCIEKSEGSCPEDTAAKGWHNLKDTQSIEVPTGDLKIKVVSTNTAAFTSTVADEALEVKDITALKAFIGGLKPYLVEVPKAIAPPEKTLPLMAGEPNPFGKYVEKVNKIKENLETFKENLETFKNKVEAVQKAALLLTLGWNELASAQPQEVDNRRKEACQSLGLWDAASGDCTLDNGKFQPTRELISEIKTRIATMDAFATALEPLAPMREDLMKQLRSRDSKISKEISELGKTPADQKKKALLEQELKEIESAMAKLADGQKIEEAGWKFTEEFIKDSPALIKGAEAAEVLAVELIRVDDTSEPKTVPIKLTEGRKITLKVAKRDAAVNTAPTQLKPKEWVFSASPDLPVRFVTGLSLMYAPGAVFPEFEEGVRTGNTDERVLWALTLGVIPRCLDFRKPSGVALGFDFHLNPDDSARALGVGFFASWYVLKVSGGVVGIKHQYERFDGVNDTYTAKPYVSLSVVGWPPFESK